MILFCGFDVKKHLNQYVNYFSIPAKLFALFEPSITKYSIQYANGEDGKSRRLTLIRLSVMKILSSITTNFKRLIVFSS